MAELERYPTPDPVRDNDLHVRTVGVDGAERSYWSPTQQPRGADVPLLIALHGLGMTGNLMARWTALAARAPALGFHVVFPDALERCWDDHGTGRRDEGHDDHFMQALVEHLRRRGEISDAPVFLAGLANGASFAEHAARVAAVEVSGIALVAGTAREASRQRQPVPRQPASVLMLHGPKDRAAPYQDAGRRSLLGARAGGRERRALLDRGGHAPVSVERIAADWEAVNAGTGKPVVVELLRRGGQGWPGGGGPLKTRLTGRMPSGVDATGRVLEFASAALA